MPKNYTVKSKKTGESFTFSWDKPNPPSKKETKDLFNTLSEAKKRQEVIVERPETLSQRIPESALSFAEMFTPESYKSSAELLGHGLKGIVTGEGNEEFPRVARARDIIHGGFGLVGPPLIAAGAVTAPIPTALGLAGVTTLQMGGEKAIEKLGPERINPELAGLGVDIASLAIPAKIGKGIKTRSEVKRGVRGGKATGTKGVTDEELLRKEPQPESWETYTDTRGKRLPSVENPILEGEGQKALPPGGVTPGEGFTMREPTVLERFPETEVLPPEARPSLGERGLLKDYEIPEVVKPAPFGQTITEGDIKRGVYPARRTELPISGRAEPTGILPEVNLPENISPEITGERVPIRPRPIGGVTETPLFKLEQPLPKVELPKLLTEGTETFPGREHIVTQTEPRSSFDIDMESHKRNLEVLQERLKSITKAESSTQSVLDETTTLKNEMSKHGEDLEGAIRKREAMVKGLSDTALVALSKNAKGDLKAAVEVELANRRPSRIPDVEIEVIPPRPKAPFTEQTAKTQNEQIAQSRYKKSYNELTPEEKSEVVREKFRVNKLDQPKIIEESKGSNYKAQLERLAIDAKYTQPTIPDAFQVAKLGQQEGLDSHAVVADLMEKGVNRKIAQSAANRAFRPRESGFLEFGKVKNEIADAVEDGKPVNPTLIKQYGNALYKTALDWAVSAPKTIIRFGNNSEGAVEIARLIDYTNSEARRSAGKYHSKLMENGLPENRYDTVNNISDFDLGNIPIKDLNMGEIIPLIEKSNVPGYNGSKLVHYEEGVRKANPGYEILPRTPGNVVDVIEKNALPANPQVAAVAEIVKKIHSELGTKYENSGAGMRIGASKIMPFRKMESGYYTHEYADQFWDSFSKPKGEIPFPDLVEKLAKKWGVDERTVEDYIKMSKRTNEILSAPQHARLTSYPDYIIDRSVIYDHIRNATKTIAKAENIGAKDMNSPLMKSLLEKVREDGGDVRAIEKYLRRGFGREDFDRAPHQRKTYKLAAALTTAKYLPYFVISNLNTAPLVGFKGGYSRLLPAMLRNLEVHQRLRSELVRTGAFEDYLVEDLHPESIAGKAYHIKGSEQYAKAYSAEVGIGAVKDMFNNLVSSERPAQVMSPWKSMLHDPTNYSWNVKYAKIKNLLGENDAQMEANFERGYLTNKQIDRAGGRMAEHTQGLAGFTDLPYEWTNPNINLLTNYALMYKRFAFAGTKNLLKAVQENPAGAPILLGTLLLQGHLNGAIKAAIRGAAASSVTDESAVDAAIREIEHRADYLQRVSPFFKDYPLAATLVNDALQGWALGLPGDGLMATVEGPSGIPEFMAGPFWSLLSEVSTTVVGSLNELYRDPDIDWEKIEKRLNNLLPGGLGGAKERSEEASD